jgi:hypothetical protein
MKQTNYHMSRPCFVKIGDFVRARSDDRFYGFVTYIDKATTGDYVEVVYDIDADSLYFYDDELEILQLIKE